MKTVRSFNEKRQLDIFRGQCFNNACVLLSSKVTFSEDNVFDVAEKLYEEGMKRDWLMHKQDNRTFDKSTGKIIDNFKF